MTPKVSFVIPCHNDAIWVNQAIQSCLKQSVGEVEVVVVDDGSEDGSIEVIKWAEKNDIRVKPVILGKNMGRSVARNEGNDAASAPVICVLDADDICVKNRVRETLDIFKDKNPDIVYGQFWQLDEFGITGPKVEVSNFDPAEARKSGLNRICHSTMAYRKGVSLNVRYDVEYGKLGLDDWKFQWDAHAMGYKFSMSRKPLSFYRMTRDGISRTRNQGEVVKLKEKYFAALKV